MTEFDRWCEPEDEKPIGQHTIGFLLSNDDGLGIELVARSIPNQYADPTNLARIAESLGKSKVAAFLSETMPATQRARSGDLGEILASAYAAEALGFVVGPSRLIHRDHKEWAMRGDDVLGARFKEGSTHETESSQVELLKVEAKSRKRAGAAVIQEAREGLERENGMPGAHSLVHFGTRLLGGPDDALGEAILTAELKSGVRPGMVTHLMFVFAGNDPRTHVEDDLKSYAGAIDQRGVVVRVPGHQNFIRSVYEAVVTEDA